MDRQNLLRQLFTQSARLTLEHPEYEAQARIYIYQAFLLDMEGNDATTTLTLGTNGDKIATGTIIAKEKGLICGLSEVNHFIKLVSPELNIITHLQDGDQFSQNDAILTIQGNLHEILAVERTLLNSLQRLSGIATKTANLSQNADCLLAATRKTLWGALDKKAVTIGGGLSHRINLNSALIIKDNHLAALKNDFQTLFNNLAPTDLSRYKFIECETETPEIALQISHLFAQLSKINKSMPPAVIMFDNMEPDLINKSISEIKSLNLEIPLFFEASGGINEANYLTYSKLPIDFISMSCLTMNANPLDLSLEID